VFSLARFVPDALRFGKGLSMVWLTRGLCLLTAMALTPLLIGCNTVEGAGEDIEETGEAIQEAADN